MSDTYDQFLKLVRARHTCRGFKPDPLPDGAVEKILLSGFASSQLQGHRRQINRKAATLLKQIMPRVADAALATRRGNSLHGHDGRFQRRLSRSDRKGKLG